jgi:hypothetical protein
MVVGWDFGESTLCLVFFSSMPSASSGLLTLQMLCSPNVDRSAPQQNLFLSTGDGGGGNDNFNNSQNDDSPLGKV